MPPLFDEAGNAERITVATPRCTGGETLRGALWVPFQKEGESLQSPKSGREKWLLGRREGDTLGRLGKKFDLGLRFPPNEKKDREANMQKNRILL